MCPEITVNFARFPATPTAREVALIEQAIGTCVENAEEDGTPTNLCKGDGKWYGPPTGGCKCKPGYQPDFSKQTCNGKLRVSYVNFCHSCQSIRLSCGDAKVMVKMLNFCDTSLRVCLLLDF